MGLGEDMYDAFKDGEEIPRADVEITDDDPPEVRRIKELIVEMTAYEASDRPTIQQVLAVLAELNAQVRQAKNPFTAQILLKCFRNFCNVMSYERSGHAHKKFLKRFLRH